MVPANILQRTFRIQYGRSTATCFTIDANNKQYIVTAKHALPETGENIKIQISHDGLWKKIDCNVVGIGTGEVDIIVLAPSQVLSLSEKPEPSSKKMFLSQDAYFLGFPYDLPFDIGEMNNYFPLPLVKKACVSMFKFDKEKKMEYMLLDGHNNPGFSGGPVVYSIPGQPNNVKIAGVISGYKFEWNKVFEKTN